MNLTRQQIEDLIKNEHLSDLLNQYQSCFDVFDYHRQSLFNGVVENAPEMRKVLLELSAVYASLTVVLSIVATHETHSKNFYFHNKKIELEKEKKDIKPTLLEAEAKLAAESYTRLKSIFEGYAEGCEMMISAVQSCLRRMEKEETHLHG